MATYSWNPGQPMFSATASVSSEGQVTGNLGVSYSDGVDTRFDKAIKGPLLNTVSLSGVGGTPANTNFGVRGVTAASEEVIYFLRGTAVAKVALATAAVDTAANVTLAARGMSAVTITTAAGTQQIGISMAASAYSVITTCAALTNADTVAVNTGSNIRAILGADAQGVVGLGSGQQAYRLFVTGAVTLSAPTWNSINSTKPIPFPVTFTSFVNLADNTWFAGTTKGPLSINQQFGALQLLSERIPASADNCRAAVVVEWLGGGVVMPLERQTRLITTGGGVRIGPETFTNQPTPIQGIMMGGDYDQEWLISSYLNRFTGTYYILASRPRQDGDNHNKPISYYCIASTTDACEMVKWTGTDGGRTLPTWWLGKGSDVQYFGSGRSLDWTTDTSYAYSTTNQNLYLTELRFPPGVEGELTHLTMTVGGCNDTQTIAVKWTTDGGTQVPLGTINKNGTHRIPVPPNLNARGGRHAPQLTFATNVSTASPYTVGDIVGDFKIHTKNPVDQEFKGAASLAGVRPF